MEWIELILRDIEKQEKERRKHDISDLEMQIRKTGKLTVKR